MAIAPDGTIYSGGQDRQILQWDEKEHPASTSVRVDSATHLMTFSVDGQMMSIAQRAGRPLIIHLPTHSERLLETPGHPLSFSSDGQTLHLAEMARINDEQGLERWMPTGRLISANLQQEKATAQARGTFVQDVQKVAGANHQFVGFLASNPQRLVIKSVLSGEQIAELPLPTSKLMSLQFSPDQSTVVTSAPDAARTRTVWDLTGLEQIADLTGHHREVCQTAFSPDGRRLATGSLDGTIRLWRTDRWLLEAAGVLTGHTRGVSDVAFSPDGKTLASSCDSGSVNLWNVETKKLLLSFSVGRFPTSVEFSPDGRILAVMTGPFYSEVDEILIFSAPSIEEIGAQPVTEWTKVNTTLSEF